MELKINQNKKGKNTKQIFTRRKTNKRGEWGWINNNSGSGGGGRCGMQYKWHWQLTGSVGMGPCDLWSRTSDMITWILLYCQVFPLLLLLDIPHDSPFASLYRLSLTTDNVFTYVIITFSECWIFKYHIMYIVLFFTPISLVEVLSQVCFKL